MFFILSVIIGVLGALPYFFTKHATNKGAVVLVLAIVYSLLNLFLIYTNLPHTASPLLGGFSVLIFLCWSLTAAISFSMSKERTHAIWFPALVAILWIVVAVSGSEIFNASKYASLIGKINDKTEKHWSQEIQPIDQNHIRLVPEELAISLAKTVLSQDGSTLGSQYPLATRFITLQKIKNEYWYIIPLDFNSYNVWTKSNGVPAYVKVSATDPYAKPILVNNKKLVYTPEAYFGKNLERHIYWKYINYRLTDFSFEEDDNSNVYWVITVMKPSIAYWGDVIEGVVLINPENGEDEFVSWEKLKDKKYAWIDRVVPKTLVQEYINYWGNLKDGWWNSVWSNINLLASETPTMNYSNSGKCIFVSPVTSTNQSDESMTGLMYTDANTGKFTYYTTSGGATEQAIINAVNSMIAYKQYHASEQIVYENIYGKLSALVPVLGSNGNYQGLAIIQTDNKRLAFGTSPQDALTEYQKIVMSAGGQITTENTKELNEFKGKVDRIGWDISTNGKQYYLYFKEFSNSFIVNSNIQSELALTKEGDEVLIKYINSKQSCVPTISFKNITLNLIVSENQKSVIKQMENEKTGK